MSAFIDDIKPLGFAVALVCRTRERPAFAAGPRRTDDRDDSWAPELPKSSTTTTSCNPPARSATRSTTHSEFEAVHASRFLSEAHKQDHQHSNHGVRETQPASGRNPQKLAAGDRTVRNGEVCCGPSRSDQTPRILAKAPLAPRSAELR
jgi:hypothetical protein